MILEFTIFGERNSGTNYIKYVLEANLAIPFTQVYGFKHWFIKGLKPRSRPNTTSDYECIKSIDQSDHTLFVYIVRNPFDWLGAMYSRPYHIPRATKTSLLKFIQAPYMSYETNPPSNHGPDSLTPWAIDPKTAVYFIEESDDIIALRNLKNIHFNNLSVKVKYFWIIRLEYLKSDIETMIQTMDVPIQGERIRFDNFRKPTNYEISDENKMIIRSRIDNPIDNKYYLGS